MLPQQYPVFPPEELPELSALRFAHRYVPSSLVSGDFFHVLRLSDDTAGVFICDVMGHGVRSALVVAMLRAIVEELSPHALDPGTLLARMNQDMRIILRQHDEPMFASAIYMVINAGAGTLRCAIAGHPRPLHVRRGAGIVEPIQVAQSDYGPALGIFDHAVFPVCEIAVAPGDLVLLFTDGLFEASSISDESGREEFGMERLLASVKENIALSTDRMLDCTLAEVRTFTGSQTFVDDVCLLAVEAAPAASGAERQAEAPARSEETPKIERALAV
jgi:sigma-B regulation protein RsbU (phosphoserine phosphatase)